MAPSEWVYDRSKEQYRELLHACRTGDLAIVSRLVEEPHIDINSEDEFGYTPLYLASLCGHIDVVEFLLFNGAECDRDTHVGARCVYGALNDKIRNLLIGFNLSKGFDASQPFSSHLSSTYNTSDYVSGKDVLIQITNSCEDGTFNVNEFKLNRFLLSARSPYFRRQLMGPWKKIPIIELNSSVKSHLFSAIVDYIYVRNMNLLNIDDLEELGILASEFELSLLTETIKKIIATEDYISKSKVNHNSAASFVVEAKFDLKNFLNEYIAPHKFRIPVEQNCDPEDMDVSRLISEEKKQLLLDSAAIPDIILAVHNASCSAVEFYPAHKSILSRSDYFSSMFNSRIFECSLDSIPWLFKDGVSKSDVIDRTMITPKNIPVVHLSFNLTNPSLAKSILSFLYHDGLDELHALEALDLFFAADELFLDKLKTFCITTIMSNTSKFDFDEFQNLHRIVGYDGFELVRIAWDTSNDRLEQHVIKILAYNLFDIYCVDKYRRELSELIQESADRLSTREATDTIELVDDIRYYLSRKYPTANTDEVIDNSHMFNENFKNIDGILVSLPHYERDNLIIDILLDELGLEC